MVEPVPGRDDIRGARELAGVTQAEAARMARVGLRAWQKWELGERAISLTAWDLFRIRAGQMPPSWPLE